MRWAWASIVATGLACAAIVLDGQEKPPVPDSTQDVEAKPRTQDAEAKSQAEQAGKDASATPGAAVEDSKAESAAKEQDQSESNANQPTSSPDQEPKASPVNTETAPAKGAATNPRPAGSTAAAAPPKRPRKIVVRAGGASEPEIHIVTGMTAEQASSQRKEAEKYLGAAEENLKRLLGRVLDTQQQETVSEVHNYLGRARSALDEGDVSRGHTLAMKANLLAEDLVKH